MDELRDCLKSRGKITLTLVMVNILIFFVMDFTGNTENGAYMLEHGAAYGPLILENGEYYRLFTSMFLHFGIEHLFGNMLTLIFLGDLLEKMIGKVRFTLIFMALLTLADGFVSTGVDYMAHLGGMLAGFLLALILVGRRSVKVVPSFPEE